MNSQKWRVHEGLLWEKWPDEVIVFNLVSGETHQLNHVASQVLSWFESSPQTIEDLVVKYCDEFGVAEKAEVEQLLSRLLEEFDDLGLVEPVE